MASSPSPSLIPLLSLISPLIPHFLSFCLCSSVYSYMCFPPTLPLNDSSLLCFIHLLLTGGRREHSQFSLHSCSSSLPRLIDIKTVTEGFFWNISLSLFVINGNIQEGFSFFFFWPSLMGTKHNATLLVTPASTHFIHNLFLMYGTPPSTCLPFFLSNQASLPINLTTMTTFSQTPPPPLSQTTPINKNNTKRKLTAQDWWERVLSKARD